MNEIKQTTSGQWWLYYTDGHGTPRSDGPHQSQHEAILKAQALLPEGAVVSMPMNLHVDTPRRQGRITHE